MLNLLRDFAVFWRGAFRPMWLFAYAAWTLFSSAATFRDNFILPYLSPERQKAWATSALIPTWDWRTWVMGMLAITILIVMVGAFRHHRKTLAAHATGHALGEGNDLQQLVQRLIAQGGITFVNTNTQNNSPVFSQHVEQKQSQRQTIERPKPDLVFKRCRVFKQYEKEVDGTFGILTGEVEEVSAMALVEFRNESEESGATVRASMRFEEVGGEHIHNVADGYWPGNGKTARFRAGDANELCIARRERKDDAKTFNVREYRGVGVMHYTEPLPIDLPGAEYGVEVQLFVDQPNRFLGKHLFRLVTRPELQIEKMETD